MSLAAGRSLLGKLYRFSGQRYVTRRIHGYRMILDLQDPGLSRGLMLFRTRELDHKVMLERFVRPGMQIFDIGGNIGYYPLMELSSTGGDWPADRHRATAAKRHAPPTQSPTQRLP